MCPASAIGPPKPNVPRRKKYPTKRVNDTSVSSGVSGFSEILTSIMVFLRGCALRYASGDHFAKFSLACESNDSVLVVHDPLHCYMHRSVCYAYNIIACNCYISKPSLAVGHIDAP